MTKNKKPKRYRTKTEAVLYFLVIVTIIRQFMLHSYFNVFLGVLTLVLFSIPKIIEKRLGVNIPVLLETIILLFIFSAEILGEINAFYLKIPIWDTLLHTLNGFLMAAVGFSLIDIFNRSERFSLKMSPFFVAFTAFCFSMTTGVLWEFFEFGMDSLFGFDTQDDWVIHAINSVTLNPAGVNEAVHIPIESVVVNGVEWGAYIDIGLIDTMKDLIVNFIGAIVFSVFGIIYLKHRGKSKIAAALIPTLKEEESA